MSTRPRKALKALAAFLVFAIVQISVQIGFAEPTTASATAALPQNIIVARLVTTNNQPITVNGASAQTGATILTGATIQTPADTGATINLGALGSVDLAPNTQITLDFDDNGNIRVKLIVGCVIVSARRNAEGEITTDQAGSAGKTDRAAGGVLDACFPPGASAPTVGQGAAANAGAGASAGAGAAAGGGGIGNAATVFLITSGGLMALAIPLAIRGGDPSPRNP